MDFLLPAVVVLVTWAVKKVLGYFGTEIGGAVILVLAFILSGIAAFVYSFVGENFWETLLPIFSLQMVIYEVVVKRIILPVLEKVRNS